MTGRRGERGAAALEFVVIVPALGLLIALMVGAARIWYAQTTVTQMAQASARAASLAVTADDARSRAQQVARAQASTAGLNCAGLQVDIDVDGFRVPVGQPATVRVHVACSVPLADLVIPGWPSSWQLRADGSSALDRYRRRG